MSSPPLQDGDESYKGDSCTSFEFIGRQRLQKPPSLIRACSANGKLPPKAIIKQRSLDKHLPKSGICENNAMDSNKINCKRSPSFKESEELCDLAEEEAAHARACEKSLKKDGCSQTDKKDMVASYQKQLPPFTLAEKRSPMNTKVLNDLCANDTKIPGPFEREIQKLLDEQNLLKNNPPKNELSHQMKDILSLDEMKNLNHGGMERDPLVVARYACKSPTVANSNNNSSPPLTHQVGLAAIQALARKQQDELNNLVDCCDPYRFNNHNPVMDQHQQQQQQQSCDCQMESSKESSLKRSRVTTPDDDDDDDELQQMMLTDGAACNKVQRVSSLPKDFPPPTALITPLPATSPIGVQRVQHANHIR